MAFNPKSGPSPKEFQQAVERGDVHEVEASPDKMISMAKEIVADDKNLNTTYGEIGCANQEEESFVRQLFDATIKGKEFGREKTTLPPQRQAELQKNFFDALRGEKGLGQEEQKPIIETPESILGVKPAASLKELNEAYKELAKKYTKENTDNPEFNRVYKAYKELSDRKMEAQISQNLTDLSKVETPPEPNRIESDLDVAKRELEKLYSPERASIDVGLDIGKGVEVKPEILVGRSIPAEKPLIESRPEKTVEQIKAEADLAERKEQKREKAKAELPQILENINDTRKRKDRVNEHYFMEMAKEPYERITGKKLDEETVKRADLELKEEKLVRMKPEEYREKFTGRAEALAEQRKRSEVLSKVSARRWSFLSNKEKLQYTAQDGTIDYNKFNVDMVGKIDAKRQELEKKGIVVSANALYALAERGMRPEDIKVIGFWGRALQGFALQGFDIKIPQDPLFKGEKPRAHELFKNEFKDMVKGLEAEFNQSIKDEAKASIERQIKRGQEMWRAKKQKHMRSIIQETVDGYKKQQEEAGQRKKEKGAKKPLIEVVTRIGEKRTPEQVEEMREIRKQVEAEKKRKKKPAKKPAPKKPKGKGK